MKYITDIWTVRQLVSEYDKSLINLNPPYQRNDIWSKTAKCELIVTMTKGYPLPAFFLYKSLNGYDVVDGQQRIRAILGFINKLFPTKDKEFFGPKFNGLLDYKITVTVLSDVISETELSDFYFRVNKFGTKLNRSEILKAQFSTTKVLDLIELIISESGFPDLGLFTKTALDRMYDYDFIAELITLQKDGISEKKKSADKLFENDISKEEYEELYNSFFHITLIMKQFDSIYPIKNTRYKQKNDFYTLWSFLFLHGKIEFELLSYIYKTLVLIDTDITPSNTECPSFANYAFHCITQSNSLKARSSRLKFLEDLFINRTNSINNVQNDVIKYYNIPQNETIRKGLHLFINAEMIQRIVKLPKVF